MNEAELLTKTDDEIIKLVGMDKLPYLVSLFLQKYQGRYALIDIGNECMIRIGECNLANASYLPVILHFIRFEKDTVILEGSISCPKAFFGMFSLKVRINGDDYDCNVSDLMFDVTEEGRKIENTNYFSVEFPIDINKEYRIQFIYIFNGIASTVGKINSMRFFPVADVLPNQYAKCSDWIINIEKNSLIIKPETTTLLSDCENAFKFGISDSEVIEIRDKYFEGLKNKKRPIWLFMDRLEKADDNGEAFFKYVTGLHPDIDCYFIISQESKDYERLQKYGSVVAAMSMQHKVLLPLADYIFTSQLSGWVENPYGKNEEYFRDIYHSARVVFLQHGVTKDDNSKWLRRWNQNLYGLISSSDLERDNFISEKYGYSGKNIWNYGMPRFDYLSSSASPKYILIMPTWRRGLMDQVYSDRDKSFIWKLKDDVETSTYFNKYSDLLNSRILKLFCDVFHYKLLFMIHPLMHDYVDKFQIPKHVLTLPYETTSWNKLFAESLVMVTDYSSVAFDFAYLKKPIIYYQFDSDDFFKSHTYEKGYFDYYSQGFGPVFTEEKRVIRSCIKYILKKGELEPVYLKRSVSFFTHMDSNCCRRLFARVTEGINEL